MSLVQVCGGDRHTWTYNLDFLSSLCLSALSLACLPAGLDCFPSSNDRIMSDMFKEVALAGGVEEAGNETHTHTYMNTHTHMQVHAHS